MGQRSSFLIDTKTLAACHILLLHRTLATVSSSLSRRDRCVRCEGCGKGKEGKKETKETTQRFLPFFPSFPSLRAIETVVSPKGGETTDQSFMISCKVRTGQWSLLMAITWVSSSVLVMKGLGRDPGYGHTEDNYRRDDRRLPTVETSSY